MLLVEAGGELTNLCGEPLTYNKADVSECRGLVGSNGLAHRQIVEALVPLLDETRELMRVRAAWRLKAACLLAVVSLLASCGALPTDPPLDLPTPLPPTAEPTPVLGVPEAGPLARYRLNLAFEPQTGRLRGQQQVAFPNRSGVALEEVVFRLYPNLPQYGGQMGIGAVWVDGQRTATSLRAADTALVVPLSRPLAPESTVTVDLAFDVAIPRQEEGYVLLGYSQGIWSAPDAYPLLAVHDGSAWHEDLAPAHGDAVFADAAFYDVTLTLPPTLTLVATGPVLTDTLDSEGQRVYRIVGGPLREFAWLASADYQVAETVAHGTTLRSYYLPGDEAAGEATLNIAAAALRAYQAAFGPYPFAEMAVAEAPLLFYGMEYAGLNLDRPGPLPRPPRRTGGSGGPRDRPPVVVRPGGQRPGQHALAGRRAGRILDGRLLPRRCLARRG